MNVIASECIVGCIQLRALVNLLISEPAVFADHQHFPNKHNFSLIALCAWNLGRIQLNKNGEKLQEIRKCY